MTEPKEDSLLWVGRVVKTKGIKGQLKVSSSGGGSVPFTKGKEIYLEKPQGLKKPFTVHSLGLYKGMTILSLQEVNRVEEAEELVGCSVYVAKEDLEPLPPDEFYWFQLLGLEVKTEEGDYLGKLEEILPTGSNDVFVVRKEGQEILIPAIEEVVIQVDLQEKWMVIRPIEGLLPEDDL